LNYENAGFFARYGFGYKKSAYVTASNESKSGQAHKVEGGYDANNLFVGLGYQYTNGWDSLDSYRDALGYAAMLLPIRMVIIQQAIKAMA
jgi:major outer membrane protein P.IB